MPRTTHARRLLAIAIALFALVAASPAMDLGEGPEARLATHGGGHGN